MKPDAHEFLSKLDIYDILPQLKHITTKPIKQSTILTVGLYCMVRMVHSLVLCARCGMNIKHK